jgi:hypothetical protein
MAETLLQYAMLFPNQVQRGIVELFAAENPLVAAMRFVNVGEAMGYEHNREADLGGVGARAVNEEFPDAAKTSGTGVKVVEGTAVVGGEIFTDIQLLASRPTRIAQKVKALSGYLGRLIVKGDTLTNAKEMDGLYKRTATADQTDAARTRYVAANGGVCDLDVLSRMILQVPGSPSQKNLIMGVDMQVRLGSVIRKQGGTRISMTEWASQIMPAKYDGVTILDPGEDETRTLIMQFNETRGTSAVTGSILCVRFGGQVDGEHLQGLAKVLPNNRLFDVRMQGERGAADQVHLEGRLGIGVFHDRCIQRYAGITDANPS